MPDQIISFSLNQFYSLANVVIGVCYASVAAAFLVYFIQRKNARFRWPFILISLFFIFSGISRLAKGIIPVDAPIKVILDLVAAMFGIPAAILAWTLVWQLKKLPLARDIEESNKLLEESNKKLMHSQQLFEGFMHHSPSLQFVKDAQLRFLYVNDAVCQIFGAKRENILGKTTQEWMPEGVSLALYQSDQRVIQTLQPVEELFTAKTAQGERTFLLVKFPIWDEQFMIGAIGIDITQQKAAEQHAAMLSNVFKNMVSAVKEYAIFMIDTEGNILTWNDGAERIKGYNAKEIIGKHFSIFYPAEVSSTHLQEELDLAIKHGQYQEENWRVRKNGTRFWANVTITPLYVDDRLIGFTKVTRDMTDRRQLEKELEIQRDKALESSATKSAFVANISHEIRTPLSGILGMNELLLQMPLTPEQRDLAQTVQDSSQSLLTVLNDVLDLSKVEAGRLFLERVPFNVTFVTQDATRLMAATAKNKGLTLAVQFDTSIPELLIGDPERFRQVLLNLIGNAVKFTHKGEITVTGRLISETADTATVMVAIKDSGIGIAQEDRKYLFVPFGQVDISSTRKHGGTGLGLTISKHLVQMMGGEIGFESEKGKGSVFWFAIPFPKTVEQAVDLKERTSGLNMQTEPTALVVEDNPTLQDLAVRQLANLGIKCMLASCGSDAIEAVNGTQFDLILMDISLPHVDGYEATYAIRSLENSRNRRTPIIAMTANALPGDKEKAMNADMDDYIAKPVSFDRLRYICEKWIAKTGSRGFSQS